MPLKILGGSILPPVAKLLKAYFEKPFWQQTTSCLGVFDHFVRLTLKGIKPCTAARPFQISLMGHFAKCFKAATRGVLRKKGVLRNFAKFTGKHLCQSLFFNKVEDLRPATLLKKRLLHRFFFL